MPRPCECDRVNECHECHRWHTSEWHRLQWGGTKEQPPPPNPKPKVHRFNVVEPTGSFTNDAGVLFASIGNPYADGYGSHGVSVFGHLAAHGLARAGVRTAATHVGSAADVKRVLDSKQWVTHVAIAGGVLRPAELIELAKAFPSVVFAPTFHSQLGHQQVEGRSLEWFRRYEAAGLPNVKLAANSGRQARFWREAYGKPMAYLPNPYPFTEPMGDQQAGRDPRILDVGSFGVTRPLKNYLTAAGAGLLAAKRMGRRLRFHMNVSRSESGGAGVVGSVKALLEGVADFVAVPWLDWPDFRRYVAALDVVIHPSYTETFSITTADAVAEGVPVVVSRSIPWVHELYVTNADNAQLLAIMCEYVVNRREHVAAEQLACLVKRHELAVKSWLEWLSSTMPGPRGVTRVEPCLHLGAAVSFCGSCAPPRIRPYLHMHQCGHPEGDEKGPNRDGIVSRLRDCEVCEYYKAGQETFSDRGPS